MPRELLLHLTNTATSKFFSTMPPLPSNLEIGHCFSPQEVLVRAKASNEPGSSILKEIENTSSARVSNILTTLPTTAEGEAQRLTCWVSVWIHRLEFSWGPGRYRVIDGEIFQDKREAWLYSEEIDDQGRTKHPEVTNVRPLQLRKSIREWLEWVHTLEDAFCSSVYGGRIVSASKAYKIICIY